MRRRVVMASTLGNAFEWFDYGIFGMFAPIISKLFFPAGSEVTSMLLTFATFAVAFAMRPLSGVLFGLYADRLGRKRALTLMIMMMAFGTGMIGLLPTYAAIGVAAPLLMVAARLIQGISVGGEFANATAMLVEYSPPDRRGYYGSFQMVSQALGFTGGALLAYLATTYTSPAALEGWGWRLPFLLGILIGPFGYWLRSNVDETPEFQRQNRDFAEAVKGAGKPVELIEAANYNHFEMNESVGNPYGPNGRAALALMKLAAA